MNVWVAEPKLAPAGIKTGPSDTASIVTTVHFGCLGSLAALQPMFQHERKSTALLVGQPLLGEHANANRMFGLDGVPHALKRWLGIY